MRRLPPAAGDEIRATMKLPLTPTGGAADEEVVLGDAQAFDLSDGGMLVRAPHEMFRAQRRRID
jgi:hypothetical protein